MDIHKNYDKILHTNLLNVGMYFILNKKSTSHIDLTLFIIVFQSILELNSKPPS